MGSNESEAVIIIVSYQSWSLLSKCLDALLKSNCVTAKIVLVDNDSQDDIPKKVRQSYPGVHVIALERNILYTAANNLVLGDCRSTKYLILLNPDVEVYPDTLKRILGFMDNTPDVGIAGPMLIRKNGSLDLACRRSRPNYVDMWVWVLNLNKYFPQNKIFGHYNLTYLDPRIITDVDIVSGAFMVIRQSLIEEIGVLDEQFPMYGSDIDYCLRAKSAGWRVVYYPEAVAVHVKRGSTSLRQKWALSQFYNELPLLYRRCVAPGTKELFNKIFLTALLIRKQIHLWAISISPDFWG